MAISPSHAHTASAASAAPGQRDLSVALVHDWLLGMRGGEWVLAALLKLFPQAVLHTLFYNAGALIDPINRHAVRPSALNALPGVHRYYRCLLPFMPTAVQRLPIDARTDLVLSTSHCVAHGVIAPPRAVHVNYYFTPMRYLYDQGEVYQAKGGLGGWALRWLTPRLRVWDVEAARRAHCVWAISHFVAHRVESLFGRPARVLYPPVRTDYYQPPAAPSRRIEEYLLVSALVPYKQVDLAIRAANELHMPLRVVGGGPLLPAMRALAGPTVTVEGRIGDEQLREYYQTRLGLIFPACEDFGLVPLEAMACGMPVLALRAGGLLETLDEGRCGAFFDDPTADSLKEAWRRFDPGAFRPSDLRAQAERFAETRFLEEVSLALREAMLTFG